jgi:hypothetical protein
MYGLDIIAEQLAGAERYYYVHDGLGSVRHPSTELRTGLVDSTGQIVTRYACDPFRFSHEPWDAQTVGQVANLSYSVVTILWRTPLL